LLLITPENFGDYFIIEKLNAAHNIAGFNGDNLNEYTLFLKLDALKHQESHISNTFVLIEYDKTLPLFYEKNGFAALHSKKYTKKTRTLPMWADIYPA
jgi:hypothetical protein